MKAPVKDIKIKNCSTRPITYFKCLEFLEIEKIIILKI